MKNKEKIKYLLQYKHIVKEIQSLRASHDFLLNKILSPSLSSLTGMPSTGLNKDKVLNNVMKLQKLDEFVTQREGELLELKLNIEQLITQIHDSFDREIFRLRYIKGEDWREIYTQVPYCERRIHQRHSRILTQMQIK